MKIKGFKGTGNGPKSGHSFGSKHGFSHSGTNKQNVKGYTRAKPKYAQGGMVTAPQASGDSSVVKRAKPVTDFDAEHGGKSPLRPGYAEGGKVATVGAAIRMMKQLIQQGNSPEQAASKAAGRYNLSKDAVKAPSPAKTGGNPQHLAVGGRAIPVVGRGGPKRAMPAPAAPLSSAVGAAAGRALGRPLGRVASPAPAGGYGNFRRGPMIR